MSCNKKLEIDYDPAFAVGENEKVYPSSVKGKWRTFKWWLTTVLLSIYYFGPFIRFDRGVGRPDQAFLIDLDTPRIFFLWIEIYPQEIYILTAFLLLCATIMFITANVFGRIWCGFLCVQTVWTDVFWAIERIVEGNRSARIRMDISQKSFKKLWLRSVKYFLWALVSFATGAAWVMYFNDAPTFMNNLFTLSLSAKQWSMLFLFSTTTFIFAGFAQGRICKYMCPWGRFQASMFSPDTIQVYYRGYRGEPRQKGVKDLSTDTRGDCIDCDACVRVCPMGIDIRNGMQIDCIGCALCIDACDDIMDRVDLKKGLIAFDTEKNMMNKRRGDPVGKISLVHKRSIFFAVLLTILTTILITSTLNRVTLSLTASINRSPLYVLLKDGSIRNRYTFKVENRINVTRPVSISIIGLKHYTLKFNGKIVPNSILYVTLPGDDMVSLDVFLTIPKSAINVDDMRFKIQVKDEKNTEYSETTTRNTQFHVPK